MKKKLNGCIFQMVSGHLPLIIPTLALSFSCWGCRGEEGRWNRGRGEASGIVTAGVEASLNIELMRYNVVFASCWGRGEGFYRCEIDNTGCVNC